MGNNCCAQNNSNGLANETGEGELPMRPAEEEKKRLRHSRQASDDALLQATLRSRETLHMSRRQSQAKADNTEEHKHTSQPREALLINCVRQFNPHPCNLYKPSTLPKKKAKSQMLPRNYDNTKMDHKLEICPRNVARSEAIMIKCSTNICLGPEHFRMEKEGDIHDMYDFVEFLGRGSYGEVHSVRDKMTGELRAVKIIDKNYCQMTDTAVDEIKILQRLVFPLRYLCV